MNARIYRKEDRVPAKAAGLMRLRA